MLLQENRQLSPPPHAQTYQNRIRINKTVYVERNIEARSCNRSCSGQAIGVCLFFSLVNLAWIAHARYCHL
jgi:hypothetical protein